MFENIIFAAALSLSGVSCSAAAPVVQETPLVPDKEIRTSEQMQLVLSEIEDFSSGVPSMAEFSHHDQTGKKTGSFVAPVIIFKESVAIFDIPRGAIFLVENINKNQDTPKIDRALVLFVSKGGKKIIGDIAEEDTTRLLQAISIKFQDYFREKPASQEISLPTIA